MSDVEIEVSFGATRGLPNYSSERADQRIRMTISVEGERIEDQLNDLVKHENILHNHLVYAVAEALGLEAALSEGGHVSLVWPEAPPPVQQLVPQQSPQQAPSGGGGGGQGPPKASREEYAALPRIHANFGDGLKVYVDQRPLKAAGKYSAKAPDFKVDESNGAGVWITDANGVVQQAIVQALAAAGVS